MPESFSDPWCRRPEPATVPVPARYRGVWQRTLLQTLDRVDETSWVHWLQLGRWHADLRLPPVAHRRAVGPSSRPAQSGSSDWPQGFAGLTEVQTGVGGETCTWHRLVDCQPPGPTPDVGRMSFETPARLVEIGVHGAYREVWERLDGSTGRCIALAEPERVDGGAPARLFVSGAYLMRVRPAWDGRAQDFEISFGGFDDGHWHIERSTKSQLEGRRRGLRLERTGLDQALVCQQGAGAQLWRILEWD